MSDADTMTVGQAQADMRRAYANAGPGQVIVGLIWIASGVVLSRSSLETGFATLFLGSFLIYPLTLFVTRIVLKRPAEAKGNAFIPVVPEGLPIMIAVLFAAWLIMPYRPETVIPLAVIATGTHYIPFQTAYGEKSFWIIGGLITALGFGAIFGPVPGGPMLMYATSVIILALGLFLWTRSGSE